MRPSPRATASTGEEIVRILVQQKRGADLAYCMCAKKYRDNLNYTWIAHD